MLAAGAQPLDVSRHGRWSGGSRSFAGYAEEATGFGDGNPTKGLLLCMPCTQVAPGRGPSVNWSGSRAAHLRLRALRALRSRQPRIG